MKYAILVFILTILILSSFTFKAWSAGPGRLEHADRNKDGVIDKKEWKMEKEYEKSQRFKVDTPLERKYDTDHDGWIEPDEKRKLLEDKYALVKTNGKAKVDTAIEAKYDTNSDGIIDIKEGQLLKQDLGL